MGGGGKAGPIEDGIDAVLPAGDAWRLIHLGSRRQAVVPAREDAWATGKPRAVTWTALAAPSGAFRPVQAVAGQRGYFYLVDAASARLCLYDVAGALLSTYPLPPAFTPYPAGRAAVFRGADGAFTFIDYGAGEAWQFADRQTHDAGATRWVARGKVKLPGGVRACAQPPGAVELFCRDAAGAPVRFDGALNQVPVRAPGGEHRLGASREPVLQPRWMPSAASNVSGSGAWIFEALLSVPDSLAAPRPLFRYRPVEKNWLPCEVCAPSSPMPLVDPDEQ